MIDTHAHIDSVQFDDDRADVIKRAKESGIEKIIVPAIQASTFPNLFQIVNSYDILYSGVGIHPHHALEFKEHIDDIEYYSKEAKVVAIGEIGLDYYYDFAPKKVQIDAFRQQLKIAKEKKLPVIVHNRDSDNDLIECLKKEQNGELNGVLHCFSSGKEMLYKAFDLGFYVSFTGNITFNKNRLPEIIEVTPLDRILLETDSPYMTPIPHRGKRNEPSFVKYIAKKISEIKSIDLEEVKMKTTENAKKLFKLSIIILLFIFQFTTYSQTPPKIVMEPQQYEVEEEYNPYRKYIGISPVIGFNTIVYTYTLPKNDYLPSGEKDVSMEGILAYGGSLSISPLEFLVVEFTYLYSKNEKFAREWDYTINPNIHKFYEFSTHWISNPTGRISIFGTLGYTIIDNKYGRDTTQAPGYFESTVSGINVGIGAYINIPTPYGLLVPSFGWRLNFELGTSESNYPHNYQGELVIIPTKVKTFFSIPRLQLIWFLPISW